VTPADVHALAAFEDRLSRTVEISLVLTADPRSEDLRRFCDTLCSHLPRLKVASADAQGPALPEIRLCDSIRYRAVPTGPELAPFLDALEWLDHGAPPLPAGLRGQLDALAVPASLEIYIAPGCRHCPATVRSLLPMAAGGNGITLSVVDGVLFSEAAEAAEIRSVPTVILDGQYRWVGAVRAEEVAEMAACRDPSRLKASVLISLIEEGQAPRLAEMMQSAGAIFPAFVELLCHDKWPVRLGAMVAFEYLCESAPVLAATVAEPLWERFEAADETAKGDILDVISQSGRKDYVPKLRAVAEGSGSEELRSAAVEAIALLEDAPFDPPPGNKQAR